MSQLVAILFYTGAACISPVDSAGNTTTVYRVPCAEPIYAPVGNPYKVAQEQNALPVLPAPKAAKKATGLCGAKKVVWFKKNGKKRYRCR